MRMFGMLLVVVLAGCHGDCEEDTCASFCSGLGEASDPELGFQNCLANVSSTAADHVLRDEAGEEIFSCHAEYDVLGEEVGTCTDDYFEARYAWCGCSGPTLSTSWTGWSTSW